jgi:hypothetical protein
MGLGTYFIFDPAGEPSDDDDIGRDEANGALCQLTGAKCDDFSCESQYLITFILGSNPDVSPLKRIMIKLPPRLLSG